MYSGVSISDAPVVEMGKVWKYIPSSAQEPLCITKFLPYEEVGSRHLSVRPPEVVLPGIPSECDQVSAHAVTTQSSFSAAVGSGDKIWGLQ